MTVLEAVARYAAAAPVDAAHARLLRADFESCVAASPGPDSVAGLAIRAHLRDRDDIYWPARIHPGSVIWPVVVTLSGPDFEAATAGYEAAALVAAWLGPAHAARWHATATAGHAGAAAAAAVCLAGKRDPAAIANAVGLALTTAGGIGRTVRRHSRAGAWHRAAAATVGLEAARAAAWGLTPPDEALTGEGGVGDLLGASGAFPQPVGALAATAIRPYPVNGFAQSAVEAVALLRARIPDAPGLEIAVAPVVEAACRGPEPWWDLASCVARAWNAEDPFRIPEIASGPAVRIHVEDRPVESVRLWPAERPGDAVEVATAPGRPGPGLSQLAERKRAASRSGP